MKHLDPRQNGALRQGIVLGFAAGASWGKNWDGDDIDRYPKDSQVVDAVLSDARAFSDLYPNLARFADKDRARIEEEQ